MLCVLKFSLWLTPRCRHRRYRDIFNNLLVHNNLIIFNHSCVVVMVVRGRLSRFQELAGQERRWGSKKSLFQGYWRWRWIIIAVKYKKLKNIYSLRGGEGEAKKQDKKTAPEHRIITMCLMPLLFRNCWNSSPIKWLPLSLTICSGRPVLVKSILKRFIVFMAVTFLTVKISGPLEKASPTIKNKWSKSGPV